MKTILYVDDEEINNFLFTHNFTMYSVITALSGRDGLKRLSSDTQIDAVISDMSMPVMNGIQFIKEVKALNENIPCFILTAYSNNSEVEEAIKNGLVVSCFSKPLDVTLIQESINKLSREN